MKNIEFLRRVANPDKSFCGCDIFSRCDCQLETFTITKSVLKSMNKKDLFFVYTRCLNDEMSPIVWRGHTTKEIFAG